MKTIRCYSELMVLPSFKERFEYLKLSGKVGEATFGFDRWINQLFYRREEYRRVRARVIARDLGCDLACRGREISGAVFVHHMNPITVNDITERSKIALDPEFLICTSFDTHNAIHYGDAGLLAMEPTERTSGDTCPWRRT